MCLPSSHLHTRIHTKHTAVLSSFFASKVHFASGHPHPLQSVKESAHLAISFIKVVILRNLSVDFAPSAADVKGTRPRNWRRSFSLKGAGSRTSLGLFLSFSLGGGNVPGLILAFFTSQGARCVCVYVCAWH